MRKFLGTLEHGAMPIREGDCYQLFVEKNYIRDHDFNTESAGLIIVGLLRNMADNLEKTIKNNGFVVKKKDTGICGPYNQLDIKKLDLVKINLSGHIINSPSDYFVDAYDDDIGSIQLSLMLEFDEIKK